MMERKMKDSGTSWIGCIPEEWEVRPARYAFSEVKQKNSDGRVQKALQFKFGTIVPKSNFEASDDEYVADTITNYTVVDPGTVMINGLNLNYDFVTQRTAIVRETGVITSAYLALKPNDQLITPEFATYLFKGYETKMALHNMGSGIRLTLGFKELKGQPILLPPIAEQKKIAQFLDAKCHEIGSISEATTRSLEEYKALKRSIIIEAVTVGIRGKRELKPSGLDWVDQIPASWKVTKAKRVLVKLSRPMKDDDAIVVCSNSGQVMFRGAKNTGLVSLTENGYQGVEPGDLLIHGMDTWHGAIAVSGIRGKCTSVVHVCDSSENKEYLCYYLQSLAFQKVYKAITNGVRQNTSDYRSWDKAGTIDIVVPPRDEQDEIAAYIKDKCAAIDRLIEQKTKLLAEIEDYKKTVIFEYVTGKKEVPVCQ